MIKANWARPVSERPKTLEEKAAYGVEVGENIVGEAVGLHDRGLRGKIVVELVCERARQNVSKRMPATSPTEASLLYVSHQSLGEGTERQQRFPESRSAKNAHG